MRYTASEKLGILASNSPRSSAAMWLAVLLIALAAARPAFAASNIDVQQPAGTSLTNGMVAAWGYNGQGQANVPAGLSNVKGIAAGAYFTLAIANTGVIVPWGNSPGIPPAFNDYAAVAAGERNGIGLRKNGTVAVWGANDFNQLTIPPEVTNVMAVAAGGKAYAVVRTNGTVVTWGYSIGSVPAGLTNVIAVAKGFSHTVALRNNGTVVAWGENFQGEADVPAGLSGVVAIAAAGYGSAAVKSDGTIVQWGAFSPQPPGLNGVVALASSPGHNLALRNDATLVGWGNNTYGQATVPPGVMGVRAVSANSEYYTNFSQAHSVALVDSSVNFGLVALGASLSKTFTIRNTGPDPLTISSVNMSGGDSASFTVNTAGMLTTIPANGSTIFSVSFVPGTLGQKHTTLRIVNNDPDTGTFYVHLTGLAVAPEIAVFTGANTDAANQRTNNVGTNVFANTAVGAGSAAQTFTIQNVGSTNLTGLALSKAGANTSDFTMSALGATTLPPNATTTFTVTFAPTATGTRSAVVNIASNDGNENPFSIQVRGLGVAPGIAVFTGATTNAANARTNGVGTNVFPATAVGSNSAPQTFTIKNVGSANLTGLAMSKAGANTADFILSTLGATTLAPNATTTFTVTFDPVNGGTRTAVINIASSDAGQDPFSIHVQGLAIAPEISVFNGANTNAANARTNGVGTNVFANTRVGSNSVAQTFTVKNTGNTNLILLTGRGGAAQQDYLIDPFFPTNLPPNATATYSVMFAPIATGTRDMVIIFWSDGPDQSQFRINVSGLGTTPDFALVEASIPGDAVAATSQNFPAAQAPSKAIDNDVTSKYLNFDKLNTGLTITPTGNRPVQALTLISAEDAPERDPSSFVLEGSNDGAHFTRFASNAVPAFVARNAVQSFTVSNTNVFNLYRVLFPTVSNAAAANSMQIAEVELLYNQEITSTNDALNITLPPGAVDVRGVGMLFDRQLSLLHKFEIAPIPAGSNTVVDLTPAAGATVLKGFEVIGAADDFSFPGRRPSSVTVAGSDDGTNYTSLGTIVPVAPSSNMQIQEFSTLSNLTAFAHYRITFGAPVSGNRLQVGEMRLFGEVAAVTVQPTLLSIRTTNGNVVVSWLVSPGFNLETKADLNSINWTVVGVTPVSSNGVNTVTLPINGDAGFFRLRK
jgi:hypothetical protein